MFKRILIAVLLIVLALPSAVLSFIFFSEQGLQLAVSQTNRLAGGVLHIEGASGRLAGPLRIRRFELNTEAIHVVAEDLTADLRVRSLLAGVVDARALGAASLKVEVKPSNDNQSKQAPHFLPGYMHISVDQVRIGNPSFTYAGGAPIVARRIAGRITLSRQRLQVKELEIEAADYGANGSLALAASNVIELAASVDGRYQLPNVALQGHAELKGTPAALDLQAQLNAPSSVNASIQLSFPDGGWQLAVKASSPSFSIAPWVANAPVSFNDVTLSGAGNAEDLSLIGEVTVPELSNKPLHLAARGSFRERVLTLAGAALTMRDSKATLTADGSVQFNGGSPVIDAHARWRDFTWPLNAADAALLSSATGEINFSGNLPYQFRLQTQLALKLAGAAVNTQIAALGTVSKENLRVAQYELVAFGGMAGGEAELEFAAPQAWTAQITAKDLNPGLLFAAFPGRLSLHANANGRGLNSKLSFGLQLADLAGELRGQPLTAKGGLEYSAQTWRGKQIQASLGANRLQADGAFGKTFAGSAELHAAALEQLDVGLKGQIDISARASGSLDTPHLVAKINAPQVGYGEWQANKLAVDADVDLSNKQDSHVDVSVARVAGNAYGFENAHLNADGKLTEHRIAFSSDIGTAQDTLLTLTTEFNGAYSKETWRGAVNAVTIGDADKKERAHLVKPANLVLSKTNVNVDELCFDFDDSHECAHGRWQSGGAWQLVASLVDLPMSLLDSKEPETLRYMGRLQAQIDMSGAPRQAWQGSAGVQLLEGAVSYPTVDGRYEALPIDTGLLDIKADGRTLNGSLKFNAGDDTHVEANAQLGQNTAAPVLQWPLSGAVRAHSTDAKILPLLVANLDRATGTIDANLQVSGDLAQPVLKGSLQLQQGELALYQLNLALRELNLLATLEDNRLHVDGKARAGDGNLSVAGEVAWNRLQPTGELQLKGENLLVADLPDYRVVASPDLNFKVTGSTVEVGGEVAIPSAKLQPQSVSGAVQNSPDARLINEKGIGRPSAFRVVSKVSIRMGDDVQVDALGLQGKLGGSVTTLLTTGETPTGRGELNINNGRYEAYGRKLDITRGRLIFDNSPLTDPGLDIQAERKIEEEDVTVGVNVRGVLRAPRLQFYSDPTMSQSQIVSYLLIGKPMDQLQGSETTTVKSASNAIALQGGGYLASQLGQRIGLAQVGVETDSNNQSALVLGKFLSPRLFVSYGISLTEAINTLKLRYTISDRWVLKTEAGAAQSADVEFKIER